MERERENRAGELSRGDEVVAGVRQDLRPRGRNGVHLQRATADLFSITDSRKRGTGLGGEMSDRWVRGERRGGNEGGERKKRAEGGREEAAREGGRVDMKQRRGRRRKARSNH